jgi:hypothetical protein
MYNDSQHNNKGDNMNNETLRRKIRSKDYEGIENWDVSKVTAYITNIPFTYVSVK